MAKTLRERLTGAVKWSTVSAFFLVLDLLCLIVLLVLTGVWWRSPAFDRPVSYTGTLPDGVVRTGGWPRQYDELRFAGTVTGIVLCIYNLHVLQKHRLPHQFFAGIAMFIVAGMTLCSMIIDSRRQWEARNQLCASNSPFGKQCDLDWSTTVCVFDALCCLFSVIVSYLMFFMSTPGLCCGRVDVSRSDPATAASKKHDEETGISVVPAPIRPAAVAGPRPVEGLPNKSDSAPQRTGANDEETRRRRQDAAAERLRTMEPVVGISVAAASDSDPGVQVLSVLAKGPSDAAGLQEDDVIYKFGEYDVYDSSDLKLILDNVVPGETMPISVSRNNGAMQTRNIEFGARNQTIADVRAARAEAGAEAVTTMERNAKRKREAAFKKRGPRGAPSAGAGTSSRKSRDQEEVEAHARAEQSDRQRRETEAKARAEAELRRPVTRGDSTRDVPARSEEASPKRPETAPIVGKPTQAEAQRTLRNASPMLGMRVDTVERKRGAYIADLNPAGQAAAAGLQMHDYITAVAGEPVENVLMFQQVMEQSFPGQRLEFTVQRDGKERNVEVTVAAKNCKMSELAELRAAAGEDWCRRQERLRSSR